MKKQQYIFIVTGVIFLLSFTLKYALAVTLDQYEPDDTVSNAKTIQAGQVQAHTIHFNSDVDWVKFTVNNTENIELKTTGLYGGLTISLYSTDLTYLVSKDGYSASADTILRFTGLEAGTYYAKVEDYGNNNTNSLYNLHLKTTVGNGDNFEGDNVPSEASAGKMGGTQNRSIVPANDLDWIKFSLTAIDNVELKTTGLQGGLNIKLYSSDLTYLYQSANASTYSLLKVSELAPGDYYARVEDSSNNDENESYNFTIKTSVSNGDVLEPDNVYSSARYIYPGTPQPHSIIPAHDNDWVQFTLSATDNIELTTSGLTGGLGITLYDNIFNLIDSSVSYSGHPLISKTLHPGKYYAVFYDYGTDDENELYYIHLVASHVVFPSAQQHTLVPILHLLLKK